MTAEYDIFLRCSWAAANRAALEHQGSSLEFKLHRLHFIDLVSHGPSFQLEALSYSRNFAPFAASHAKGNNICAMYLAIVAIQRRITVLHSVTSKSQTGCPSSKMHDI